MKLKKSLLVVSVVLLTACAGSRSLYYWGNYNEIVYEYLKGEGDPAKQENELQEIIAKAQEKHLNVGPGVWAQLGLVQTRLGHLDQADESFNKEMTLYPESAHFFQYMKELKEKRANAKTALTADDQQPEASKQSTKAKTKKSAKKLHKKAVKQSQESPQ